MKQDRYAALQERSDHALLSRSFRSYRPEDEPDILEKAPEDISGAIIESRYTVHKDEPKVRCRQCREAHWKANHRQGYVVRYPGGAGVLVGKSCGKQHYGASWSSLVHHFEGLQSRQFYLRRRLKLLETWPAISREIEEARKGDGLRRYDVARRSLEERLPRLFDVLITQITQQGATITRERRVRDYRQEERQRGEGPVYTSVSETVGTIAGARFLKTSYSIRDKVASLHRTLGRRADKLAEPTDTLTDKALRSSIRAFEAALRETEEEIASISALTIFTERGNIEMICRWMNETRPDDGHYSRGPRAIEFCGADAPEVEWFYQHVGTPHLPALRRVLGSD